jgi:hypothetical protein
MSCSPINLRHSFLCRNITLHRFACLAVLVLGILLAGIGRAADEEPVWKPWLKKRLLPAEEAATMMQRFVDRQLEPLPLPASREAWVQSRQDLRAKILATLGLQNWLPPNWDLRVRQQGTLRRDGYRVEKLTYESYPGMAVPALLYVPEGIQGRVPGIVSIAGHVYGTGKATEYLQRRNINLVRRGCVVLAYDYIDCGERNTGPDALHGKPYGGGNDHGIRSFSFSTRTPTALEILDGVRALDLLAARPEVDPERLGFTGESGGGNSTYWMAAVDPRVKLAVPVSSVTTFDYWIRHDRNWDWHQRPFGVRRHADIGVLLALHAPQPLLVLSSRRRTDDEEFPVEEAQKSVDWARHVYRLLGAENAVGHVESTTGHGYQEDKRKHLYAAVERWLRPPFPKGDAELPAQVEPVEQLRCGLPPGNRTFRDVYAEWLQPLPRKGTAPAGAEPAALRVFLRDRLGLPDPLPKVRAEKVGAEGKGGYGAEFWILQPEPGIRLPAVVLGRKDALGAVVLIPGRDEDAVARALTAGRRVLVFDPRSTGEAAEGGRRVDNFGWFFGRPSPGMWALDIQQAARFARETVPGSTVILDAPNRFGWAGLLAGAARPDLFASGTVSVPAASLHDLIRERKDAALADVPGLLERLDVAQLKGLSPGGTVTVIGAPRKRE